MSQLGIQEILARRRLVEHRLPHLVVAAMSGEALLGAVVDAGRAQTSKAGSRWRRSPDRRAHHLRSAPPAARTNRGCRRTHQVAPDLAAVQRSVLLCLQAIEQGLRPLEAL